MEVTEQLPQPPWQRRNQRKPARPPLSQDLVVDTALAVLGEEGLDAVTMRRVAQALDTGPASLYAHVSNKDELHELMADRVMGEIALPEVDPARWREVLKGLLFVQFGALTSRPGIARIVASIMIPAGPNLLRFNEVVLALLRAGGLSLRYAAYGADVIGMYVKSFAVESSEWRGGLAERPEMRRKIADFGGYLAALPPEQFPNTLALGELFSAETAVERFEFGLDILLDGLAAKAE